MTLYKNRILSVLFGILTLIFCIILVSPYAYGQALAGAAKSSQAVIDGAASGRPQELLVLMDDADVQNEAKIMRKNAGLTFDSPSILEMKAAKLKALKQSVISLMPPAEVETLKDYKHFPVMFMKIKTLNGLSRLLENPKVVKVYTNEAHSRFLRESLPLINQPAVAAEGKIGTGTAVAVLDTGVNYTLPAFGSCTAPGVPSGCKVVDYQNFTPDAGDLDDSGHGSNVAGIVLGVAPDSKIAALDVFRADGFAYTSDILAAIDWVIANKDKYNIVAMNMSFGSAVKYTSACPESIFASSTDNARQAGILSTIASGNSGWIDGISQPACVPSAVSVGAVYDSPIGPKSWSPCTDWTTSADMVACFSNSFSSLTVLAPGALIDAAGLTAGGTSQASPHIAGAIAVLRAAFPSESLEQTLFRVTETGVSVLDTRNGIVKPRLDLQAAVSNEIYSISGNIKTASGSAISGVAVSLSGDKSATTTTDSSGNYSFKKLADGAYIVTPAKVGLAFTPENATATIKGANVAGLNFTGTASAGHFISGIVKTMNGTPLAGVSVALSGSSSGIAVTDGLGRYALEGLDNGTYTVLPVKAGYSFIEPSKTVLLSGVSIMGMNFTAVTYSISGTVTTSSGTPLPDVTITYGGAAAGTVTTAANGTYTIAGLPAGSYTLTPAKTGYTFSPVGRSVTLSTQNLAGQNFVAQTYSITGVVRTSGGVAMPGVTITLSGAMAGTTTTNASGQYFFINLIKGTYTIIPGFGAYIFTPTSRTVTISTGSLTGQDFWWYGTTGFTINVVDNAGNPVSGFNWLVEEDTTHPVTPGAKVANSLSVSIHKSYAPVVLKGTSTGSTAAITMPTTKRYAVSVLPFSRYSIGGANVAVGQKSVTVRVQAHPIPTAQISVYVFYDNRPINGAPDTPGEAGLPNFKISVFDQAGNEMMDVFGNPLGTTYLTNPDGTYQLDVDGNPIVNMMGQGVFTDATGNALIKYLAPGKYGIRATPTDGQPWVQTATIEGTPGIDAWVKAGEPPYFTEAGFFGWHVFIGFVKPITLPPPAGTVGNIKGQVVDVHQSRPPLQPGLALGNPVAECWVGLNDFNANGEQIYSQPCNPDSTFDIQNVPPGTYQLVMWDKNLDSIIDFRVVIVPATGGTVDLGKVPIFRWFGFFEGTVFYDMAPFNGFRDAGEMGIPNQTVNLRFRDGSIYQSTITDVMGEYGFAEVFPFFRWIVAEVDYARYKPTGATITVDDGGPLTPGAKNNPQLQPENGNLPYRTETGPVLTEGMILYADQTNTIDWGKAEYAPDENGGISGIVYYSSTRAENDPRFGVAETWEPGIPRVQVNLYADMNGDGIIDKQSGTGAPVLSDVNNYPYTSFPGPEDIDRNGNRIFDGGDAINVVHTDSWDDSLPTGCVGPAQFVNGQPIMDCAETLRTWNQVRPAVFDGGYMFDSYYVGGYSPTKTPVTLPTGTYIVEVVPPPGYEIIKEEDKNVEVGDKYVPFMMPPTCVGNMHTVPQFLSLDGAMPAPFAGQNRPLCDRKQVTVLPGKNTASDFFLFTLVPKAGRLVGLVTNDVTLEFNPNNPRKSDKLAPSWMPISIQDFRGKEIVRVYTDEWGQYNALVPSTATFNIPNPSGVSPNMVTVCLNHPGPIPDPKNPGKFITDPQYNPSYTQTCTNWDVWPARTTYIDTPILPIGAFTTKRSVLDCEFKDKTPVIYSVSGPQGGPYANAAGDVITIMSMGPVLVPNPDYDPKVIGSASTITRDFGFGSIRGTVTVGSVALTNIIWSADGRTIQGTVPAGMTTGQLIVKRGDNGRSTVMGATLNIADGPPIHVSAGQSIQTAINNAAPNSLILVGPGVYTENLIMWKPLRLQGWGAGSTIINAGTFDPDKEAAWLALLNSIVGAGEVDLVPGERADFFLERGAGIMVLAKETDPAKRFGSTPRARIDGFTITGAVQGGGIFANGYAHYLEISNNKLLSNQGHFGGGIRIGTPSIVNVAQTGYNSSFNDNVGIRNNYVNQNGATVGGGGIGLFNGSDNYSVTENYICGNYTLNLGGGIAHNGLSKGGLISNNKIVFNESFVEGAGLIITGELVPAGAPLGTLSEGAGSVIVNGNLIQGNMAGDDGGGLTISLANGQDVQASPLDPNGWYKVGIYNNIIVNNVSGFTAGGMSFNDAVRGELINNTIAYNDSTSTGIDAFGSPCTPGMPPGNFCGDIAPGNSIPQVGGIAARAHTPGLRGAFGVGFEQTFSNPLMHDNIIWRNRSFYWNASVNGGLGGLLPDAVAPYYWDLAVYGTPTPQYLNPMYGILTNTTGYSATNRSTDPMFFFPYSNVLEANAVGATITITFKPLMPTGDYHIRSTSSSLNRGGGLYIGTVPELGKDYDGETRPSGGFDSGADEYYTSPARYLLKVNKSGMGFGTVVSLPAGINCGISCAELFSSGASVRLTATASTGSVFAGWLGGGCAGTLPCTISMNSDRIVTALFNGVYAISGNVKTAQGVPISGVTITLTGDASAMTVTDTFGNYAIPGLPAGNYLIVPSKTGYAFTPANRSVAINIANVTGQNFTGAALAGPASLSISGLTVNAKGTAVSGVIVTLKNETTQKTMTAVTDSFGDYRFTQLSSGTYTLTASKEGHTATPLDRSVVLGAVNAAGQNFTIKQVLAPMASGVSVQCPGDINGDGISDDPNIVCKHLAAGDGFVNMADGYSQYTFGFMDVTGVPPEQVMTTAMLNAEFPGPTIQLKEGQEFYLTLTNVGMTMRPDLFDAHTVHWHGFVNASTVFDGEPMASFGINMGASLTYYYKVLGPGTYMYHCHVEATEHMQMGMLANLSVTPFQNDLPNGTPLGAFTHLTGYKYAYNDGDGSTYYDVEFPIQIHAFDPNFHDANLNVQPLPFADIKDTYPMLNGRGYPQTIDPNPLANSVTGGFSQKIHSLITATKGHKILLRISNLSFNYYTLTVLGIPMKVVGRDAKLLRGPTGLNLYQDVSSIDLGGGQTADIILDTTAVPAGTYFLYTTNLNNLSNNAEERGGMMTEIVIP